MVANHENIHQSIVHRSFVRMPVIERAAGVYLFDEQGNRYLDGASGSALVTNLGHAVEPVIQAITNQLQQFAFAAPHAFSNRPLLKLGQALRKRAPGAMRGRCRSWINNTGTDAVDDAVRLARQYFVSTGQASKTLIISRWGSFHGNAISTAGFHGHTGRRRLFQPMFINHPHIPPAFCYRCPFGLEYPGCDLRCAHALESEIRRQGEENIAAFIAEPVVGAALGAVPAPDGYFEKVREICDQYHVLFIADEVMTGFGRLGTWFGMETYTVTPDIVACGKGMGAGYVTIGATIAQEQIWQAIEQSGAPFMAGHTMNQNPVACSGTLAVIETIEQEGLLARVQEIGRYLEDRLNELRTHPHVGDVRGRGLMYGIEFVQDKDMQQPFDPGFRYSSVFCQETLKRGLVLYPCQGAVDGVAGDMVLIAPPFIISESEIDEMLGVMERALQAVQSTLE